MVDGCLTASKGSQALVEDLLECSSGDQQMPSRERYSEMQVICRETNETRGQERRGESRLLAPFFRPSFPNANANARQRQARAQNVPKKRPAPSGGRRPG